MHSGQSTLEESRVLVYPATILLESRAVVYLLVAELVGL